MVHYLFLFVLLLLTPEVVFSQTMPGGVDLPAVPYGSMSTLLEKSIFKVDVLTLEVRVDQGTSRLLGDVARGREYSDEVADSIAAIAIAAPEVLAQITFVREISLDQFLDGTDRDMRRAVDAHWLEQQDYERIKQSLPQWFAFLEERRLLKGDEITYHIRGDSLTTVYRGVDGTVLLAQTDVGQGARESVLGTYFAPKSSFRSGLVRSLFVEREDAGRR